MRLDHESRSPVLCIRKRARLMTEQRVLDERVRERSAVHADKGMAGAIAQVMNRARDEIFASAGFAGDQDRTALPRDFRNSGNSLHEHRRLADHHRLRSSVASAVHDGFGVVDHRVVKVVRISKEFSRSVNFVLNAKRGGLYKADVSLF